MNLVVLSGELSDLAEIHQTAPDNIKIDGCLIKRYTMENGEEFTKKFFFYVSGKTAKRFMKEFEPGDKVLIRGKLTAFGNTDGTYCTKIVVQSMSRMAEEDYD